MPFPDSLSLSDSLHSQQRQKQLASNLHVTWPHAHPTLPAAVSFIHPQTPSLFPLPDKGKITHERRYNQAGQIKHSILQITLPS